MSKSLFDDVPEPIFDTDDEEEQPPVATEEEVPADDQPDIPPVDDDSFEDIGQQTSFGGYTIGFTYDSTANVVRGSINSRGGPGGGLAPQIPPIDFSQFEFRNQDNTTPAISGWRLTSYRNYLGNRTILQFNIYPPAYINGTFYIRWNIPAGGYVENTVTIDNRSHGQWSRSVFTNVDGVGPRMTATFVFTATPGPVQPSDFEVRQYVSSTGGVVSSCSTAGWTISVTGTGLRRIISATPPRHANNVFFFRLKQNSINFPGTGLGPAANIDQRIFYHARVDTRISATWSTPVYSIATNQVTATITFDDSVTGVSSSDFRIRLGLSNVGGWSISVSGSGSTYTITATPPSNTNNHYRLVLRTNTVMEGTNTGPPIEIISAFVSVDNRIIPTWGTPVYSRSANTLTATIMFNRSVTGVTNSDFYISTTAGSINWPITVSGSGGAYTLTATPPSNTNGNYGFGIRANSVSDTAVTTVTGPGSNQISVAVSVDNTIVATWGTISFCGGSNTVTAPITFNESVTGVAIADFDIILNSSSTVQNNWTLSLVGSGTDYTVTATPPPLTNGIFRIRIKANSVLDSLVTGPTNNTDSSIFNVDNRIEGGEELAIFWSNMVGGPEISGRLTFTGRDVSGISASNFELRTILGRATAVTITVSASRVRAGQSIIVTATPNRSYRVDGELFLRLKQDSLTIGSGTGPGTNIDSDLVELNTFTIWGDPIGGRTLSATMTFGSDIINLETTDFEVIDDTDVVQTGWTIAFSPSGTTSRNVGQTLRVICTPPVNTADIYRIRLKATSLRSSVGSADTIPKVAVITKRARVNNLEAADTIATWSNMVGGPTISGTLTFGNRAVTSIQDTDFELRTVLGRATTVIITPSAAAAQPGQSITVTVEPLPTYRIDGEFFLRLKKDSLLVGTALGPNENIDSNHVELNTFTVWGDPTGGTTLSAEMTFGSNIINIAPSDFEVIDDTDVIQTGWTIVLSPNTTQRTIGQTLTVTATPPSNTADVFRLRLKATSLRAQGSSQDTIPKIAVITKRARVNNIDVAAQDVIATWSNMVGGPTISGTLTFGGKDVSDISASDFELRTILGRATAVTITPSATEASAGSSITVTAVPANTYKIDGELFLRLKEGSLTVGTGTGPEENVDSPLTELNTFTVWGDPTGGRTLSATMTFGSDLTRIAATDFDVIDQANEVQADWTIAISPDVTTRDNGESLVVSATPPANTADLFRLRLNSQTLRTASGSTDTVPKVAVVTKPARVNNIDSTQVIPQVIIGIGSFCPTSNKITWPISVVNADAMQFLSLDEADISITDSSTATPALTDTIVDRGANSFSLEITVPAERNGTASITVAANALGASTNPEVTSNTVSYDTRTALTSTTITYGTPVVDNPGRDIEFPVTFSDIGEGLTGDDFSISATNGVWSATIRDGTGGPNTKVIVVTNTEPFARMGSLTITLVDDAFTNRTITGDKTSPSVDYDLDSTITETTVTYINLPGYGTQNFVVTNNNRTIEFRLEFSNIGAGLTPDDFTVNATNGNWVVSLEHEGNNRVRVTVTETGSTSLSGSLTITIDEDAFFNRQITGNRVSPSATYALTTSTTLPSVNINLDRTGPIRLGEEFSIFFTWDRDVTTFDDYDVRISYGIDIGGIRATNRRFFGSGRAYRLTLSVIRTDADVSGGFINVSVSANALEGGNVPAFLRIPIGYSEITPTLLTANEIDGDGIAYTKDALYTIGQDEADTVARLRSYNESGVLQTNNLITSGPEIDQGQQRHARSIDILDNRFLISARYFGSFGIARATGFIEDSRTFNKLFINSGDYVNSFEVTHSIQDPIEDARLRNHPDPDARVGNERVLARIPARAIQRRNEFVTRQFTTQRVATDTVVQGIAVGSNRIYLLVSGGSVSEPNYDLQIYDLFGQLVTSISVDTNTENRKEFGAVPISLGVTSRFLYLGFASFEDPLTGLTVTAPDLYAYTLDGERWPAEDIKLNIGQGAGQQDWYYGVISMDWNETDSRMWMIVRRVRKLDAVTEQWFGYFDLSYPVEPKWSAIPPQTLQAGDTLDLKEFAGNISTINFAAGVPVPSWVSLSNGVLTIATSSLPATNTTERLSFIGIGTGRPAYVSFELRLLREAPTWRTI